VVSPVGACLEVCCERRSHGLDRYRVKCIMVKPAGKLSLQSHRRSEHWVVVKGTLEVTKGDEVELLSENQSTYLPFYPDEDDIAQF
jgi:mannose-6-phosphate isomerase-like protein (cupin superfamily)